MKITKESLLEAGYMITSIPVQKKTGLVLVGEFSHGDADHESQEEYWVESIEELDAVIKYLKWRQSNFSWNEDIDYRQRCKGEKMEDDCYAQVGEQWRDKYLWDSIIDWWPRDVTYSDIHARLNGYRIVFFDGNTEWSVSK